MIRVYILPLDVFTEIIPFAGTKLKELVDAAENYHMVLAENRKLYNKVQDLKGTVVHLISINF